ncbi:MAG: efflux RND transporter periplasmic adaptor subunit [Bacteroidales bacterium]|jgi:RND family efflux transporter MFP subunit|nr:efflux RND transporter periplasmic adaptor subunit [Bacteroidales bacterium]MBQ2171922.1 efflux RND transporter periplasmic adaptor subunit [Bacteroidales bacterium]
MKKSILLLAALAAAVACGNQGANQNAAPEETIPNVEVATAVARDVPQDNVYASTVQAYAVNNIAPQTAGRIRKINVEVGDYVVKGQILAEMDRLQLDQTELQVQNDDIEYERLKGLYKEGGVSQSDFETAELGYKIRKTTLENLRENTILRSPITGFVSARNFDSGDLYSMSSPLFTVQQVTPVKLLVGISESEYTKIKKGDSVSLTVDAIPGETFTGKVDRLYPTIDPATHTFKAEVVVPNANRVLRPGMYARVTVNFGTRHSVIVPDMSLVKQEGTGTRFIYVLKADNTVSYLPVTIGRHMGQEYEILSGLEEGSRVVVKGQSLLKDGVKVNVL